MMLLKDEADTMRGGFVAFHRGELGHCMGHLMAVLRIMLSNVYMSTCMISAALCYSLSLSLATTVGATTVATLSVPTFLEPPHRVLPSRLLFYVPT